MLFTAHGWAFKAEPGLKSRLYLWADRLARRVTTTVVCVSETERLTAGSPGLRRRPYGRHPQRRRGGAHRHSGALRRRPAGLITVGRFQAPKDYPTLVAALARLREVPVSVRIVGGGPDLEAIASAVRAAGLEETVEFLGERDDVRALLAAADCFVLASHSEGLPLSVLEAMAAGLPVVASDVGGVHELVVDGETGTLVVPNEPHALAGALRDLLLDPARRQQLGAAGWREHGPSSRSSASGALTSSCIAPACRNDRPLRALLDRRCRGLLIPPARPFAARRLRAGDPARRVVDRVE